MIYYCHWCKKELVAPVKGIDYDTDDEFPLFKDDIPLFEKTWNLSCPDYHSMIRTKDDEIIKYKFFIFFESKRYEVFGHKGDMPGMSEGKLIPVNKTLLYSKIGNSYNYVCTINKFLPMKLDDNNVLQADAVLERLKKYVVFT